MGYPFGLAHESLVCEFVEGVAATPQSGQAASMRAYATQATGGGERATWYTKNAYSVVREFGRAIVLLPRAIRLK